MLSRVSHQPLKQKKVQAETEPPQRLAHVSDIDVPGGAGGSDPQHWPVPLAWHSPKAKYQAAPKARSTKPSNTLLGLKACRENAPGILQ